MGIPGPGEVRFGVRTLIVAAAVTLTGWALFAIVADEGSGRDGRYCLYQNQYYSPGAFEETGGILRECAAGVDGTETMQWVDPR